MQIYVHRNNQQLGPFTEAEVKAQLASGAISPQDHVWWSGQQGWVPLSQSPLMTGGLAAPPRVAATVPSPQGERISGLAIGALVSNLVCCIGSLAAIILGHMALSAIKKDPTLKGRGMALAGLIIGYFITALCVVKILAKIVLLTLGPHVHDIYTQLQAEQATNSANRSTSNSDQTANAPAQSTPTPPPTNSPDQSTNSPSDTTNALDQTSPARPSPATNSPDTSTNNAPDSSTNAAPMNP